MLIQANSQTERTAEDLDADVKPKFTTGTFQSGDDIEMLSVEDQQKKDTAYDGITIKEEMLTDDCPPTASSTPVKLSDEFKMPNRDLLPHRDDDTEATLKMEVDDELLDGSTLKPSLNNPKQSADADSKDINIDPRTYCKLGHFHLLLEEYPKGIKL